VSRITQFGEQFAEEISIAGFGRAMVSDIELKRFTGKTQEYRPYRKNRILSAAN